MLLSKCDCVEVDTCGEVWLDGECSCEGWGWVEREGEDDVTVEEWEDRHCEWLWLNDKCFWRWL